MYTLLKPLQIRKKLISKEIHIFTPQTFSQLFETNKTTTKHFLETQVKSDLLIRLKRGLYALKTDPPIEEEIANQLYKPSYISFEYALSFYGLLPEMPYAITSATTKATRSFTVNSQVFSYRTIKREVYTGYSLLKQNNRSYFIADQEKAYLDYLYFVFLGKNPANDRLIDLAKSKINKKKLLSYLSLFKNSKFTNFVKTLI